MRYIGRLAGEGTVSCNGEEASRASFDFDGFENFGRTSNIVSSGEIRLPAEALAAAFNRGKVQLLTDDGRRLTLTFSERVLRADAIGAHVDVTGELPDTPRLWNHGS